MTQPVVPNGTYPTGGTNPETIRQKMLSKLPPELFQLIPLFILLVDIGRWIDAYRHALATPAPCSHATRVLLARYNLLEICTYIYRGYQASKKADP